MAPRYLGRGPSAPGRKITEISLDGKQSETLSPYPLFVFLVGRDEFVHHEQSGDNMQKQYTHPVRQLLVVVVLGAMMDIAHEHSEHQGHDHEHEGHRHELHCKCS